MKTFPNIYVRLFLFTGVVLFLFSFGNKDILAEKNPRFPYRKAGLTESQAAAHLLNRFTFGPQPGQVNQVVKMGLENWLLRQLKADLPDEALNQRLAGYATLKMTNQEILQTYPKGGQLKRMALKDGIISRDAVNNANADKKVYNKALQDYMQQKGFRPQRELVQELINQKILRAAYSQNQLQEVLTNFWFNHFNVSFTDNDCTPFITTYERDAIRPNVFGKFENILIATAKAPAMLAYLDNYKSSATFEQMVQKLPNRTVANANGKLQRVRAAGLNENYAREVMELHTLGVDGGYTQQDVTQAARVLTGWTFNNADRPAMAMMAGNQNRRPGKKGQAVPEGDFVFMAIKHDTGEKTVLGTTFPAGGGYEEGVKLLNLLAHQPATARFISTKLATRFVSDNPPKSLVDKMAKTFLQQDGDLRQVLLTMTTAPEFWSEAALREKTKSPFELAISSVRSLNADIKAPYQLYNWITKMGEKMYYYQAPTGFPDKGQYWINTGSLLNRMNFGLALASGRIPGVKIDLAALNQNREPESTEAALFTYSQYLLPERDLNETIKRLTPTLNDPEFGKKIEDAAGKTATPDQPDPMMSDPMMSAAGNGQKANGKPTRKGLGKGNKMATDMQLVTGNNTLLAQVVGTIIGSPEFQRK